jgi:hypothetical protein
MNVSSDFMDGHMREGIAIGSGVAVALVLSVAYEYSAIHVASGVCTGVVVFLHLNPEIAAVVRGSGERVSQATRNLFGLLLFVVATLYVAVPSEMYSLLLLVLTLSFAAYLLGIFEAVNEPKEA